MLKNYYNLLLLCLLSNFKFFIQGEMRGFAFYIDVVFFVFAISRKYL